MLLNNVLIGCKYLDFFVLESYSPLSGALCSLGWSAPHRLPLCIKRFGLRFQIASSTLGKDALISGNRAHTRTVVAVVAVVPVRVARIEVQVVGVARVRRVLRGRPVVAVRTGIVEAGVVAAARCWQEDASAVGHTSILAAIDTVHCRPFVGAVVEQFLLLVSEFNINLYCLLCKFC